MAGAVGLFFVRQVVQRLFRCMFVSGIGAIAIHDAVEGMMPPSVMVRFYRGSAQSTRARVSTDSSSCTSVFLRAKRMAASAKLSEVSSTRPSGGSCRPRQPRRTPRRNAIGRWRRATSRTRRPRCTCDQYEQHAQRHDEEGHPVEDGVDALVEVGHGLFVDLRLRGQGGGIAVRSRPR